MGSETRGPSVTLPRPRPKNSFARPAASFISKQLGPLNRTATRISPSDPELKHPRAVAAVVEGGSAQRRSGHQAGDVEQQQRGQRDTDQQQHVNIILEADTAVDPPAPSPARSSQLGAVINPAQSLLRVRDSDSSDPGVKMTTTSIVGPFTARLSATARDLKGLSEPTLLTPPIVANKRDGDEEMDSDSDQADMLSNKGSKHDFETATIYRRTRNDTPASSSSLSSAAPTPAAYVSEYNDHDSNMDAEGEVDEEYLRESPKKRARPAAELDSDETDSRASTPPSDGPSFSVSIEVPSKKTRKAVVKAPASLTEVQAFPCFHSSLRTSVTACVNCRDRDPRRSKNDEGPDCLFQNWRVFQLDDRGDTLHDPATFSFTGTTNALPQMEYRDEFNEPCTSQHAANIKTVAAKHLLPTLRTELEHAKRADAVSVRLDPGTRTSCDTCGTSVFSGSWSCRKCAQEICMLCHHTLSNKELLGKLSMGDARRRKRCSGTTLWEERFGPGGINEDEPKYAHREDDFVPLFRWPIEHMEATVAAMNKHLAKHTKGTLEPLSDADVEQFRFSEESDETAHKYILLPKEFGWPVGQSDEHDKNEDDDEAASLAAIANPESQRADLRQTAFKTEEERMTWFRRLWARGEPVVMDFRGTNKLSLPWDPKLFVDMCGTEECEIASNLTRGRKLPGQYSTVGDFFASFGPTRPNLASFKIKDWPPSADFRDRYPAFYKDFIEALPFPSVTRLDGVLNLAAHTPSTANPVDLGPKGYFSEMSDDIGVEIVQKERVPTGPTRRAAGTTKLHMDLADAINLMPWSYVDPTGKDGVAAWDIYRAQDSDEIRDFLYWAIGKCKHRPAATVEKTTDDPIHRQEDFLDQNMRKLLLERKNVKSYRIYQRPGQAVLIPAGCAHQVCNLSACIKLASDFVSLENVHRCEKVTSEFGTMTKENQRWREDILQLKNQLWWAWHSALRFHP